MANRGSAARGAKAAQNKDRQKGSRHLHNCGLSFLAIRRPPSYPNQLPWQGNFSRAVIYFESPNGQIRQILYAASERGAVSLQRVAAATLAELRRVPEMPSTLPHRS